MLVQSTPDSTWPIKIDRAVSLHCYSVLFFDFQGSVFFSFLFLTSLVKKSSSKARFHPKSQQYISHIPGRASFWSLNLY